MALLGNRRYQVGLSCGVQGGMWGIPSHCGGAGKILDRAVLGGDGGGFGCGLTVDGCDNSGGGHWGE